jgi:hypothetical protein
MPVAGSVFLACAVTEPDSPTWLAASVVAISIRKWRLLWLLIVIFGGFKLSSPGCTASPLTTLDKVDLNIDIAVFGRCELLSCNVNYGLAMKLIKRPYNG